MREVCVEDVSQLIRTFSEHVVRNAVWSSSYSWVDLVEVSPHVSSRQTDDLISGGKGGFPHRLFVQSIQCIELLKFLWDCCVSVTAAWRRLVLSDSLKALP